MAALNDKRLKLSFQPVVDIASRAVVFHEGLLRLERADGTIAMAEDFIELCESLGLIRLIDHYVLARTLETLEAAPEARISVNISGETVGDAEWLSLIAAAVARRPDLSGRLIVEITETAVIRNLDEAASFVATLHDLGCPLALDDFGAGFSSFRSLRSLKADIIKIAGVFLKDLQNSPDDQVFIKALVAIARNFDMKVVAEWVEDEATVVLLGEFGVDMIQGNLIGAATSQWPWGPRRPDARHARSRLSRPLIPTCRRACRGASASRRAGGAARRCRRNRPLPPCSCLRRRCAPAAGRSPAPKGRNMRIACSNISVLRRTWSPMASSAAFGPKALAICLRSLSWSRTSESIEKSR